MSPSSPEPTSARADKTDAEEPCADSPRSRRRFFLFSDPLLHFVLAAIALMAAHHYFGRPEISISPQLLNGLRKDFEARSGRSATAAESDKLGNDYLEDEILYQEALRTGLTQDGRVRSMLIQTMRTSLRPILGEPSDAELEALRKETPEAYRYPAKVSFAHVSYADEKDVPPNLLETVRANGSTQGLGNLTKLPNPMPPTAQTQIDWMFGAEFSAALAKCEENVWSGPLKSRRGVHFVRVIAREQSGDMPLSEVRPKLVALWIARNETAGISAKVQEMRTRYRVSVPEHQNVTP